MKSRLKIRLKLWKNKEMIKDTTLSSIRRIFSIIRTTTAQKGYLKVSYLPTKAYNDGGANSKQGLLGLCEQFTNANDVKRIYEIYGKEE